MRTYLSALAHLLNFHNNVDLIEVLKHSKNYFSASIASKFLAFLSLPIITWLIPPSDYGIVQVFHSYIAIFLVILTLNFHGSIARYYYDEPTDFGEFILTSLAGSYFFLIIGFIISTFWIEPIGQLLSIPPILVIILFVEIFIRVIHSIFDQILISKKESGQYAKINFLRSSSSLICGISLVFVFRSSKYLGLILGELLVLLIFAIYILHQIHREIKWKPQLHHLQFIANYSLPLMFYNLSNIILGQIDRVLINKIVGPSEAGLYSFAYMIGVVVDITTSSLQSALIPDWFKLMRNQEYERVDRLVTNIFKITLVIALVIILFSQEILIRLTDKNYHAALPIIPIVVMGYVFNGMFKVYGRTIGFTNKMIYVTLVGFIAGLVNYGLNIIYIPQYGYIAGAYTTVISFAVMFLLSWVIAKYVLKQYVTPLWLLWQPTLFFIGGIAIYYGINMLNFHWIIAVFIKILLLIIFCAVLLTMQGKQENLNSHP